MQSRPHDETRIIPEHYKWIFNTLPECNSFQIFQSYSFKPLIGFSLFHFNSTDLSRYCDISVVPLTSSTNLLLPNIAWQSSLKFFLELRTITDIVKICIMCRVTSFFKIEANFKILFSVNSVKVYFCNKGNLLLKRDNVYIGKRQHGSSFSGEENALSSKS